MSSWSRFYWWSSNSMAHLHPLSHLNSDAVCTRRAVFGALLGLIWIAPRSGALAAQHVLANEPDLSENIVSFEWEIPQRYANRAARYLEVGEDRIVPAPDAEPVRGGPVVVLILAAVAVIMLARAIISIYRDVRYGGMIVQDVGGRLYIRHDRRLPGRVIIIKDRNGITVRELRGDVNPGDIVRALPQARAGAAR